jgi:membrane associated rhomboid family serine protease
MVFVSLPTRHKQHLPWAAILLAVVATLTYLWTHAGNDGARQAALLRWGTLSASPDEWRLLWHDGRLLTLVTALFIHANLLHLVGNGVFLLIFGVPAEKRLGAWRLLVLFLLGGALANFVASLVIGSSGRVIVGASGGISALVGAYLVLFPRAKLGIVVPLGLWLEFVRAPAALLIGLWAALQLLFTFVGPAFGAVAWWAHLTGFVVGVVLALLFQPGLRAAARPSAPSSRRR